MRRSSYEITSVLVVMIYNWENQGWKKRLIQVVTNVKSFRGFFEEGFFLLLLFWVFLTDVSWGPRVVINQCRVRTINIC